MRVGGGGEGRARGRRGAAGAAGTQGLIVEEAVGDPLLLVLRGRGRGARGGRPPGRLRSGSRGSGGRGRGEDAARRRERARPRGGPAPPPSSHPPRGARLVRDERLDLPAADRVHAPGHVGHDPDAARDAVGGLVVGEVVPGSPRRRAEGVASGLPAAPRAGAGRPVSSRGTDECE